MDKIELTKWVLDYHFGIYSRDGGISICAACAPNTTWPCHPARLARLIKDEEQS